MKRSSVLLVSLFAASAGFANGTVTGKVVNVRIDQSGKGIVYFDQTITGSPSCSMASYENGLSFDANTAGGRAIMARALAAKAAGETIKVTGSGACIHYGNSWVEDWLYGDHE
jgi:hypothetical protein